MPSAPLAVMPFDPVIVSPASTGTQLNSTISASATNRLDVLKRLRIIKHKPTPRSGQDSGLSKSKSGEGEISKQNRDHGWILCHRQKARWCVRLGFLLVGSPPIF